MGIVRALRDSTPGIDGKQPPAIPSDAALVEASLNGQSWAHEALFRRYVRMASGLAYRLTAGTDIQVDDVVQDAFVTAFERLSTLRSPEAFSTWLGSIVLRQCSKRLRRHRLRLRFGLARKEEVNLDLAISGDAPPDVSAALRQAYALLERLKPEERVAFLLRRVEGLTVAEIAERLELSLSTVKRRLRAGEERLERALGDPASARTWSASSPKDASSASSPPESHETGTSPATWEDVS